MLSLSESEKLQGTDGGDMIVDNKDGVQEVARSRAAKRAGTVVLSLMGRDLSRIGLNDIGIL